MSQIKEGKGIVYLLDDPSKLIPSDENDREDFDFRPLMASIKKYGVRYPLLCEKSDDKDRPFKLRDGHRRLLALTKLAEKGEEILEGLGLETATDREAVSERIAATEGLLEKWYEGYDYSHGSELSGLWRETDIYFLSKKGAEST